MNRMSIIGNLTKEPELRTTQSGVSVCSFTVAVNRRKRGQNGEELPPMFYRVTVWRQLAEICGKFLRKASKVYVDGELSVSTYQGNDGQNRFSLEIDGQNIEFLSSGQSNEQTAELPVKRDEKSGFEEVHTDELPF